MAHGGCLKIRTCPANDDDGEKVAIEFEDTGIGMPVEVCDQAFEPFYTTRESGGGTGLGLSTVHGIVMRFGGQISLRSTPSVGTFCRIIWPVCDISEDLSPPNMSAPDEHTLKRPGRILAVDDHEAILEIISEVLTQDGYQVERATSVGQGIARINSAVSPFDMVISDVNLIDGNGSDVVTAVKARWTSIRSLFISGYTADALSQLNVFDGQNIFLQKPFHPTQLL